MADVHARSNEAELITRCQRGDAASFDTLINAHLSRVYNLAYRMLGTQQDAEDAAQEAFIRAYSSIKKFRRGASFATWMHRITVNVCLDELKRRRGRPLPMSSLRDAQEEPREPLEAALLSDQGQGDPAQSALRREERAEIEGALACLPAHHRAVVIMCDMQECSYEEAAAALGLSVGTVKSRLHRAREKLRQLLAPKTELIDQKRSQRS